MYLDTCYEIVVMKTEKIKRLTALRLCTSHLTHNMMIDIKKNFKKRDIAFICAIIGEMFDIDEYDKLQAYIKKFIILMMSEYESEDQKSSLRLFASSKMKEDMWTQNEYEIDLQQDFMEFDTIFRNSNFFQHFDKFLRQLKFTKGKVPNEYFNPKFVATFLKKYVAYLPLWTSIMTGIRSSKMEHANNGYIEGKPIN